MTDPGRGRSLELYFVEGTPDGLVTAEMFNWTGHVLMVPWVRLETALRRPEAGHTGVHLLMGESEGRVRLYIGETERLSVRLRQHAAGRDWWDHAVLVTARADALNKAHARYIEARLVETARGLGRDLENGNIPGGAGLSEAQAANMEGFLSELRVVLPALGVSAFDDRRRAISASAGQIANDPQSGSGVPAPSGATAFELRMAKHSLVAHASQIGGEFFVREGSFARAECSGAAPRTYAQIHQDLVASGVLVPTTEPGRLVFVRDYAFNSTSAAGAVVAGRSCAGPVEWRVESTGQTYRDWEAARLAAVTEAAA
ncbi:GIY-YIG nuclease family protein [Mangrovicoccus sp. HB161399]|uniref:GIY-YIG nuclease family protein n=1 Tax=Mangrovicoccus sp. HB161399 TaxID=2720392 RepID=UPI001553EB14|nr:GIY-YIG nuclease family protein [Mangrovicoccus sp. HB161399]